MYEKEIAYCKQELLEANKMLEIYLQSNNSKIILKCRSRVYHLEKQLDYYLKAQKKTYDTKN